MRPLEALKERIADERRRDKGGEMPKPLDLLRERNGQSKLRKRRNARPPYVLRSVSRSDTFGTKS